METLQETFHVICSPTLLRNKTKYGIQQSTHRLFDILFFCFIQISLIRLQTDIIVFLSLLAPWLSICRSRHRSYVVGGKQDWNYGMKIAETGPDFIPNRIQTRDMKEQVKT